MCVELNNNHSIVIIIIIKKINILLLELVLNKLFIKIDTKLFYNICYLILISIHSLKNKKNPRY